MKYPSEKSIKLLIGQNVKKYRLEKGFSQAVLCYQTDIDISTLSRLERGGLNVTIQTLYKIGAHLDVPLEEFFKGV